MIIPYFDTWKDFETWYYSIHACQSDDPDKERAELERFAERNAIVIAEDL